MVDGCINERIVEEGGEIGPELGFPLSPVSLRIVGEGLGNRRLTQLRIENRRLALHNEHVSVIDAEMVAMFLVQQPKPAVRRADTNEHTVARQQRGQYGTVGLDVGQG